MSNDNKAYMGDGVYAANDPVTGIAGTVVLTTENGIEATNTIVLEPEVLQALLDWITSSGMLLEDPGLHGEPRLKFR